jgi:type III secretion protein N (ATPase)
MLLKLGEYQPGHDPLTDCAVDSRSAINDFLQQSLREPVSFEDTLDHLAQVTANVPL